MPSSIALVNVWRMSPTGVSCVFSSLLVVQLTYHIEKGQKGVGLILFAEDSILKQEKTSQNDL